MTTNPRELLTAFFRELSASVPDKSRIDLIARALIAAEPRLSAILYLALLEGYYRGAKSIARRLAAEGFRFRTIAPQSTALAPFSFFPPTTLPPITTYGNGGAFPPNLRFPGIDAAVEWLARRELVTSSQFNRINAQAQQAAFTIARFETTKSIEKIRDAVSDVYQNGGTLESFRAEVDPVTKGVFSPSQVETLYRTNVGLAQAAGQRAVMENEYVVNGFPYIEYSATHDSRVRPEHLAMETHGQNGTAIYRADDPIWNTLWPPCSWNCRCVVIPLSIEDAAARGSAEARLWLKTGIPPTNPVYARSPYPIIPPVGWPTHVGVMAVV